MKQSHRLPIPEEEQVQPKSQPHVQVPGEKAREPWDAAGVLISSLNLIRDTQRKIMVKHIVKTMVDGKSFEI